MGDNTKTNLPEQPLWRPGEIWFQKLIPRDRPWGKEELLFPVPKEARGKLGVLLGEPAEFDGKRHATGDIVEAADDAQLARMIAHLPDRSAAFFPWYDRLVPGPLLLPHSQTPDLATHRYGLQRLLFRGIAAMLIISIATLTSKGFRFYGLILVTIYGLHPIIGACIGLLERLERRTVEDWNRHLVNEVFFARWIGVGKSRLLVAGVLVLVLLFLGQIAVGLRPSIRAAALVKESIRSGGEWWRLVTPGLMHGGFIHILMNAMALASVGKFLTRLVYPPVLAFVFLVSVVTGCLASLSFGQAAASVGASGGILGCFGFLLVLTGKFRDELPASLRASLLQSVVVVAIFGWLGSGFIDNAGHAGGFAGGILLAIFMKRSLQIGGETVGPITRMISWASIGLLALAALKVSWELWKIHAT